MCGLVGWVSKNKTSPAGAAEEYVINQYEDQHTRGQRGFGIIAVNDNGTAKVYRATEPNKMLLDMYLKAKGARHIFLHHRAPTSTENTIDQTHPMVVDNKELDHVWLVLHNGVITNASELREKHLKLGYEYLTEYKIEKTVGGVETKFNDAESFAVELARFLEGKSEEIDIRGSAGFIAVALNDDMKAQRVVIGTNETISHGIAIIDLGHGWGFASEERYGDELAKGQGVRFDAVYKGGKLLKFERVEKMLEIKWKAEPVYPRVIKTSGDADDYYERMYGPRKAAGFGAHGQLENAHDHLSMFEREHREKAFLVIATLRKTARGKEEELDLMRKDWRNIPVEGVHKAWSDQSGSFAPGDVCKRIYERWMAVRYPLIKEATENLEKVANDTDVSSRFRSHAHILTYLDGGPLGRVFRERLDNAPVGGFNLADFSTQFASGNMDAAQKIWEDYLAESYEWLDPDFILDAGDYKNYLELLPKDPKVADYLDAAPKLVTKAMKNIADNIKPFLLLSAYVHTALALGWQFWLEKEIQEKGSGKGGGKGGASRLMLPAGTTMGSVLEAVEEAEEKTSKTGDDSIRIEPVTTHAAPPPAAAPGKERAIDLENETDASLNAFEDLAGSADPETVYSEAEFVADKIKTAFQVAVSEQLSEAAALALEQGIAVKIALPMLAIRAKAEEAEKRFKRLATVIKAVRDKETASVAFSL